MIAYVVSSVVWSVFGLALGDYIGRMRAEVNALRKRVIMQSGQPSDVTEPPAKHWRPHWPTMQQLVGFVVVIMALVSILTVHAQSAALHKEAECSRAYTKAYAAALKARDLDGQRARADLITYTLASADLWHGFLTALPNQSGQQATELQRAAALAALNRYFASNAAYVASLTAVQLSAQHYPIPSDQC